MSLPSRLAKIAAIIPTGKVIADIGTDHALLPLYLVEQKIAPRVIAVEAKPKPYLLAAKSISQSPHGHQVELRRGNGFYALRVEDRVEAVVLAGLGDITIRSILQQEAKGRESIRDFILQPMTHAEALRCWLAENCYRLTAESLVLDKERIYEIMTVQRGTEQNKNHPYFPFGHLLIEQKEPLMQELIADKIKKTTTALDNLAKAGAELDETRQKFLSRLEKLREVLKLVS